MSTGGAKMQEVKNREMVVQDIPRRKDIPLIRATDLRARSLAALWRMTKYPAFVYVPAWPTPPTAADGPQKDATLCIQSWE